MPDHGEEESENSRNPSVAHGKEGHERHGEGEERRKRGDAFGAGIRICAVARNDANRSPDRVAGHQQRGQGADDSTFVKYLEIPAFRLIRNVNDALRGADAVEVENRRPCFGEVRLEAAEPDTGKRMIDEHVPRIEPDEVTVFESRA